MPANPVVSPITFADLSNHGWGEPYCGHTAFAAGCPICLYWSYQSADMRAGIAAKAKVDLPWLYSPPTPEQVAAAWVRLKARMTGTLKTATDGSTLSPRAQTGRFRGTHHGTQGASWSVTVSATAAVATERIARPRKAAAPSGPGTELEKIYHVVGMPYCSSCAHLARQMDRWGVAGCREHLEEIVAEISGRAKTIADTRDETGKVKKAGAVKRAAVMATVGAKLLKAGLPLTVRGQVEEAIRRAEVQP